MMPDRPAPSPHETGEAWRVVVLEHEEHHRELDHAAAEAGGDHGGHQARHPRLGEQLPVAGHGSISTPGFMIAAGSSARLAARSASANRSGRSRSYQGRW